MGTSVETWRSIQTLTLVSSDGGLGDSPSVHPELTIGVYMKPPKSASLTPNFGGKSDVVIQIVSGRNFFTVGVFALLPCAIPKLCAL